MTSSENPKALNGGGDIARLRWLDANPPLIPVYTDDGWMIARWVQGGPVEFITGGYSTARGAIDEAMAAEAARSASTRVLEPALPAPPDAAQSRVDSLMEALTNVAVGFLVSMAAWVVVSPLTGIYITLGQNLAVTGIFTVVSILRQYVLRRLFNGRSIW